VTVDITTEIVIDRLVDAVARVAADPTNAPKWYENIESVSWKTEPPPQIGSLVTFQARFLGRRLEYTYEIVELDDHHLVMRTAEGPFPMETTYTFTPVSPTSTRMTLRNRGEPSGFSKVAAPLMVTAMRRANQKDLAKLKALVESERP
jgi:uncharacterized membrane protein